MAGGAWVGEEREFSEVACKVGSADAHAVGAHDGLAGCRVGFIGSVDEVDFLRGAEFDGLHDEVRSAE